MIGERIQRLEKGSSGWRKNPMNGDMDPMILLLIKWLENGSTHDGSYSYWINSKVFLNGCNDWIKDSMIKEKNPINGDMDPMIW